MPEFPVSFIIFLFLIITLSRISWARDKRLGGLPKITLAVYAGQSVLLGLHWSYGYTFGWPIQGAVAALIPPLTWLTLRDMVTSSAAGISKTTWLLHSLPAGLVLVSPALGLPWVDFIIISVFVGYGIALLRVAFRDDVEWLDRIPFQGVVSTNAAFKAAGIVLVASALVDLAVSYDISRTGGELAPSIVGIANFILLVVLSLAIVMVGNFAPRARSDSPGYGTQEVPGQSPEEMRQMHADTLSQIDKLMISRRLYRDPNLSLDRLARKALIPTRQISSAINSQRALNVPQYVNMFRIIEACDFLKKTELPITEIIFDVGFQTKSNFNREFQRIVGMSPSAWRQQKMSSVEPSSMRPFIKRLTESTEAASDELFDLHEASSKT